VSTALASSATIFKNSEEMSPYYIAPDSTYLTPVSAERFMALINNPNQTRTLFLGSQKFNTLVDCHKAIINLPD